MAAYLNTRDASDYIFEYYGTPYINRYITCCKTSLCVLAFMALGIFLQIMINKYAKLDLVDFSEDECTAIENQYDGRNEEFRMEAYEGWKEYSH